MKVSDSSVKPNTNGRKTAGFGESFLLGVGIAGGGLASSLWQQILTGGMWEGLIAMIIIIVGYLLLDLSLSEMVSVVPFAGGSFGYVRCSIGPFYGYMIACSEMVLYMFYTISTVLKISQSYTHIVGSDISYEPLWALFAYAFIFTVHVQGTALFWKVMLGCTIFTFALIGVYIVGSLTVVDINQYALNNSNGFNGSISVFMEHIYSAMWLYMGICALPLMSGVVKNEGETIPKAMMSAVSLMAVISIIVLFCVACEAPGIGPDLLYNAKYVLQYGFENIFHIPSRIVPLLLLVPTYASATGFMFACKHQVCAMAESGLMPAIFKTKYGVGEVPIFAVLGCCTVQYALYLLAFYLHNDVQGTFRVACIAGSVMYIGVLSAFITFRYKYENMERSFVSWPGVPGAVLGIMIFLFVLAALVGFQGKGESAIPLSYALFMFCMAIYYFAYVQFVQFFSKEEQCKFMKAYILNANKKKKQSKYLHYMISVFNIVTGGYFTNFKKSGHASPRSPHKPKISSREDSRSGAFTASQMSSGTSMYSNNSRKVNVEPFLLNLPEHVANLGQDTTVDDNVAEPSAKTTRGSILRSSLTKAVELNWSGKYFNDAQESRKAFAILTRVADEDDSDSSLLDKATDEIEGNKNDTNMNVAIALLEQFPDHFVISGFSHEVAMEEGVAAGPSYQSSSEAENDDKHQSVRCAEGA